MTLGTSGISGFYIYSPSVTSIADLHGLQVDGEVLPATSTPSPAETLPSLLTLDVPVASSSSLPPNRGQTLTPELRNWFRLGQGMVIHQEHHAQPCHESCPYPGSALLDLLCSSWDNSMKCLPGKLAQPLPHQSHLPGPNWKKPASGAAFSKQIMAANNRAAPRQLQPAPHGASPEIQGDQPSAAKPQPWGRMGAQARLGSPKLPACHCFVLQSKGTNQGVGEQSQGDPSTQTSRAK